MESEMKVNLCVPCMVYKLRAVSVLKFGKMFEAIICRIPGKFRSTLLKCKILRWSERFVEFLFSENQATRRDIL